MRAPSAIAVRSLSDAPPGVLWLSYSTYFDRLAVVAAGGVELLDAVANALRPDRSGLAVRPRERLDGGNRERFGGSDAGAERERGGERPCSAHPGIPPDVMHCPVPVVGSTAAPWSKSNHATCRGITGSVPLKVTRGQRCRALDPRKVRASQASFGSAKGRATERWPQGISDGRAQRAHDRLSDPDHGSYRPCCQHAARSSHLLTDFRDEIHAVVNQVRMRRQRGPQRRQTSRTRDGR